jgi:hypothetical protein
MSDREHERRMVEAMLDAEVLRNPPKTQEDVCAIAARCFVAVNGPIHDDHHLIEAAYAGAQGFFGEAFKKADEGQRWTWIDMLEHALREASRPAKSKPFPI